MVKGLDWRSWSVKFECLHCGITGPYIIISIVGEDAMKMGWDLFRKIHPADPECGLDVLMTEFRYVSDVHGIIETIPRKLTAFEPVSSLEDHDIRPVKP